MLHYPRLIFQISKATVKRFRYVLFKTNKIITKLKISYCNIFMFTFAKPEQLSVIKVNCIKILLKYMLKYVTTNANYCKTIPKKNNFYSALCSQISETLFLVHDACLRSYFKNSCLVFHRGFQTLENNKSTRP